MGSKVPLRAWLYMAEFMYERDAISKQSYVSVVKTIKDLMAEGYE